MVPEVALGAGEHLVSVGAVSDDGADIVDDITMAIKVGETADEQPLVALLPQTETEIPQLLQSPDDQADTAQQIVIAERADAGARACRPCGDPAPAVAGPALAPRSLAWEGAARCRVRRFARRRHRCAAEAAGNGFGAAAVGADGAWQISGRVDLDEAGG